MAAPSVNMDPKLSIIIVSWNVRPLLEANLRRLFALPCRYPFEVFVVDNGSSDGSARMVRETFPQVHLIQNDWDAGFAGPNNQALRLAKGEVVVLLNPDMLVEEGALEKTYESLMADRSIGVMGIRLNHADGTPVNAVRRFPTFGSQFAILLKAAQAFPRLVNHYMAADFDYGRSQDVDQVRGSYFAFRRELLETVGYLDAAYHIWFEEVDYCLRVKKAGMRVWYCAEVSAHDLVGRGVAKMKHLEKQEIFTASMIRYFRKWHPRWQSLVLQAFRPLALALAWGADVYESVSKKKV